MSQVKIYGHRVFITTHRQAISNLIQTALQTALGLPADKRFQRFFLLEPQDFIHPTDRTQAYLILEIHLFTGRTPETLQKLIGTLQDNLQTGLKLHPNDLEITLIETPAQHWGIRGRLGHQLQLSYEVQQ